MDCLSEHSPTLSSSRSLPTSCFIYEARSTPIFPSANFESPHIPLVSSFSDLTLPKAFCRAIPFSFIAIVRALVRPIVFPLRSNHRLQMVHRILPSQVGIIVVNQGCNLETLIVPAFASASGVRCCCLAPDLIQQAAAEQIPHFLRRIIQTRPSQTLI